MTNNNDTNNNNINNNNNNNNIDTTTNNNNDDTTTNNSSSHNEFLSLIRARFPINLAHKSTVFDFQSRDAIASKISYAHMSTIAECKSGVACAFQCSSSACEGTSAQHIRFCTTSNDSNISSGRSCSSSSSWSDTKVVMYGLQALWSPVLFAPKGIESDELILFYTESRKQLSPGGDIKLVRSTDFGKSWSEPETIMTHEAYGGVPKVIANRVCKVGGGRTRRERLLLPFWTEPTDSWLRYEQYHPMQENENLREKVYKEAPRGGMNDDCEACFCAVMWSDDNGKTWTKPNRELGETIEFPKETWLIENSCCAFSNNDCEKYDHLFDNDDPYRRFHHLQMFMRSGTGHIWEAYSDDYGLTWTDVRETKIPNPNSKVAVEIETVDPENGGGIMFALAMNPSKSKRSPLGLLLMTGTHSLRAWYAIEDDCTEGDGNFAYPTVARLQKSNEFLVTYSSWTKGIKAYRIPIVLSDWFSDE